MKKSDPHSSSSSSNLSKLGVQYKNESEVNTYTVPTHVSSESVPYPHTTIKSAHSQSCKGSHSPKFRINVAKISREESYLRLNKKFSGKNILSVSTGND